jgi:hypothetical protein
MATQDSDIFLMSIYIIGLEQPEINIIAQLFFLHCDEFLKGLIFKFFKMCQMKKKCNYGTYKCTHHKALDIRITNSIM